MGEYSPSGGKSGVNGLCKMTTVYNNFRFGTLHRAYSDVFKALLLRKNLQLAVVLYLLKLTA